MEKLSKMDFIFITLKAYSIPGMVKEIVKMFKKNTSVITAYNGMPWWYFFNNGGRLNNYQIQCLDKDRVQWNLITPERIIGCVVYPATEIIEPGIIKHMEGNRFSLGELDGTKSDRVLTMSKTLVSAGLKAPIRNNIRQDIWTKLIGNLAFNPLSVITGETLDVLVSKAENKKIAYSAMKEASLIMDKLEIPLNISIEQRIEGAGKVGKHKTSMLQDFEQGKQLEIDALIVAVKEIGTLLDIKIPTIDKILIDLQKKISP
jgi:2-dehydropantoate 2-reductase